MLGPHLHVSGVVGSGEGLRQWAAEVGADDSWAATASTAAPPEVQRSPRRYRPGMVQAHSDHMTAEMRLWQSVEGGKRGHYLLHQPGVSRLDFTPALAK